MDAMPITAPLTAPAPPDASRTMPILIAPHPMLKARARPVGPADEAAVRDLVPQMFTTMYRAPGIGLAAPQVGPSAARHHHRPDAGRQAGAVALINPEIVAAGQGTGDA